MLLLIIDRSRSYWERIKKWAVMHSDGCTGVPDWYVECCWEHDFHFRYARTVAGDPINFDESNLQFRKCIQTKSRLGRFSPLSWIRWFGVQKVFGRPFWDRHRSKESGIQPVSK